MYIFFVGGDTTTNIKPFFMSVFPYRFIDLQDFFVKKIFDFCEMQQGKI